jgi:general secretion pathway protein D
MKNIISYIFIVFITYSIPIYGMAYHEPDISEETTEAALSFNYENEDLVTIIDHFAQLKNVNVIFPQADPINTKITLTIDKKLTLEECWSLIITLLDIAGYTMVPRDNTIRIVKSNTKDISREPMPTYIGVSLDQIPKTDQVIRYLHYLANIKVSDAPENELNGILKDLLPDNALFKADSTTNGLLLVAKANDIHAVMKIITELDTVGFQEKVDILPLTYTTAGVVAQLLNDQILKTESTNTYRLDTKKPKEVPYFSGFTKIIPEERLNKLILLGRAQAVDRLKSFIQTYIDVAPDSGKSTLHVYKLQYLDAAQFAPVLKSIVEGSRTGGPSQARGGEKTVGGVERFFDEVIIMIDKPTESEELKFHGGNKLIVAARNDDWRQIRKIIEELDQPQLQVLLEVLIADLTADDSRFLGAMTRFPDKVPLPDQIAMQAAHLGSPPMPNKLPDPTTLNADLLQNAYVNQTTLASTIPATSTAEHPAFNIANFATVGTTMLALNDNDGETWSILELAQIFGHKKIISHPHIVSTNNKEAAISIGEQRYLTDAASGSLGGTTVITRKPINANLKVTITPRISTADTINLQVDITINEFIAPASTGDNTQAIRTLKTNANIKNGGIFALGGLIKNTNTNSISETPFFSKVPILGWFFKSKKAEVTQNNLTVFICPTVIQPRLRGGVNQYTSDYIALAKDYASEELFTNLKDPITHWFFRPIDTTDEEIDAFVERCQGPLEKEGAPTISSDIHKKEYEPKTSIVLNEPVVTDNTIMAVHLPDLKAIIKDDDPNPFKKS